MKHSRKNFNEAEQGEFVGILWQPLAQPFRLQAGDVFRFDNRLCRVLRVNECAAVIVMNRPVRNFKTRFELWQRGLFAGGTGGGNGRSVPVRRGGHL